MKLPAAMLAVLLLAGCSIKNASGRDEINRNLYWPDKFIPR